MATISEAAALLRGHDSFLILTHARPDGDTIGSGAALCQGLRLMGKTAFLAVDSEITARFDFLTKGLLVGNDFKPQFIVAVDIADGSLLPATVKPLKDSIDLCIDHHPSNGGYAKQTVLCGSSAATGELIWMLLQELGVTADTRILQGVYTAISTDTGCFLFPSTSPRTHRIAAECIEKGLEFMPINREFFQKKTVARLKIEQLVYGSLEFSKSGRVAGVILRRRDIDALNADYDDLDNVSSLLLQMQELECGILLTENTDQKSAKVSVRSRAPISASDICANFGGGGHPRAAGCTINGDYEAGLHSLMSAAEAAVLAVK